MFFVCLVDGWLCSNTFVIYISLKTLPENFMYFFDVENNLVGYW